VRYRKGEHGDNDVLTLFWLAPVRFLPVHVSAATSMTTTMPSMAPAPVAITILAAFHPVAIAIVAAVRAAIVILPAHGQSHDAENHQQTKYYRSL
jgi:hypothetical protein